MSTTTTSKAQITSQPLAHYNPEVERRVNGWFASGRLLVWIPILSQENFPRAPLEVLRHADQCQEAMRMPIRGPDDLLLLPAGITGWLMPAEAEDTDVACGVWEDEVYILGVTDQRTGRKRTLLGECADATAEAAGQGAV